MKTHEHIPGWFHLTAYYDEIYEFCPDHGCVIEIGCWQGRSTVYFADLIRKGTKRIHFYAVDVWKCVMDQSAVMVGAETSLYWIFLRNLARLDLLKYVIPLRVSSVEGADLFNLESVDAVILDGAHAQSSVEQDIIVWRSRLKPGGQMVGDDYCDTWPGVKTSVDFYLRDVEVRDVTWRWVKESKVCLES